MNLAAVTIGFVNTPYQYMESNGFATITVEVISGTLDIDVEVRLTTADINGEAICKYS